MMLEYACYNNHKYFNFGRSTLAGDTYKLKKKWNEITLQYKLWKDYGIRDCQIIEDDYSDMLI